MKHYFISDPHFGHSNIIKYDNRPFKNVTEMNKTLIDKWNNVVKDDDIVYVLGDFGYMSISKIKNILDKLNGTKILIKGNHDGYQVNQYINAGFALVVNEITVKFGKTMFKLSHYPYRESKLKEWWEIFIRGKDYTHINKKKPNKGIESVLIHGHTHNGAVKIDKKKRQIHVGCFLHDYCPVSLQQIHNMVQVLNNND
jgi:calcineurin-like phosphoesterase family protein